MIAILKRFENTQKKKQYHWDREKVGIRTVEGAVRWVFVGF